MVRLIDHAAENTPEPRALDVTAEPTPTEVNVLTIHYWQAPSVPSPYLSGGNKDTDAAAVTLEPLAKYDPEGNIVPALAAEIPTIENGGVSRDLMSITWLKEGLKWSDGTDVTARTFPSPGSIATTKRPDARARARSTG